MDYVEIKLSKLEELFREAFSKEFSVILLIYNFIVNYFIKFP